MNYVGSAQTISVNCDTATSGRSSAGAVRARRLCAGLVLAAALFGTTTPARADDGLGLGDVSGGSIEATIATVQATAVAQASAVANGVVADVANTAQASTAPQPSTPQPGSASGVGSGISSAPPAAPRPSTTQSSGKAPSSAAPGKPDAAPAVVAPANPVVSAAGAGQGAASEPSPQHVAPAAAFEHLARQYQKNPGRYHALNSLPISHQPASIAQLQSLVERAPFVAASSAPKSRPNPLQKCLEGLPSTALRTDCQDLLSQLSDADLGAVAHVPVAGPNGSAAQGAAARSTPRAHRGRSPSPAPRPKLEAESPQAASAGVVASRSAAPTIAAPVVPKRTPKAAGRATVAAPTTGKPRGDRSGQLRIALQPQTPQRDSAGVQRPAGSAWPWLGVALLLIGITSIGLALGSVGPNGAAAASAIVARARTTSLAAAGLFTHMRSKGLSAGANGPPATPKETRPGIRYRD